MRRNAVTVALAFGFTALVVLCCVLGYHIVVTPDPLPESLGGLSAQRAVEKFEDAGAFELYLAKSLDTEAYLCLSGVGKTQFRADCWDEIQSLRSDESFLYVFSADCSPELLRYLIGRTQTSTFSISNASGNYNLTIEKGVVTFVNFRGVID